MNIECKKLNALISLLLLSAGTVSAAPVADKNEWLFSVGTARSAGNNLSEALSELNYGNSMVNGDDDSLSFSIGYRLMTRPKWSVDLSYLNQKTARVELEAAPTGGQTTEQAAKDIALALPIYGQGVTLVNVRHIPVFKKSSLMLGVGSFIWWNERKATIDGYTYKDSDNGLSPLLQVGVGHKINQRSSLELNAQRFFMSNEDIDRISLGFTMRF